MYILLTRISNVTFNPQLVFFDRLPNKLFKLIINHHCELLTLLLF